MNYVTADFATYQTGRPARIVRVGFDNLWCIGTDCYLDMLALNPSLYLPREEVRPAFISSLAHSPTNLV